MVDASAVLDFLPLRSDPFFSFLSLFPFGLGFSAREGHTRSLEGFTVLGHCFLSVSACVKCIACI